MTVYTLLKHFTAETRRNTEKVEESVCIRFINPDNPLIPRIMVQINIFPRTNLMKNTSVFPLLFLFLFPFTAIFAETPDDWNVFSPKYGGVSGKTHVAVAFPKAGAGVPVTFGIPVGQARSIEEIALLDEHGKEVPASFFPLGNWSGQPARWAFVSIVLDDDNDGDSRALTIRWGKSRTPQKPGILSRIEGSRVTVENGLYTLAISPRGVESVASGGSTLPLTGHPAISLHGAAALAPKEGTVTVLYDGPIYKRFRFVSLLADSLELHQEYEVFAGSPYVQCAARFINRSLHGMLLDCVVPLEVTAHEKSRFTVGVGDNPSETADTFAFHQRAFDAFAEFDGASRVIPESENSTVWVGVSSDSGPGVLFVFPRFRDMAAGDSGLESVVSGGKGALRFAHYLRTAPEADVRLRETMARTFTWTMVVGVAPGRFAATAHTVMTPPTVVYDRDYLTSMGVFPEDGVSHLFDSELSEGAHYFLRAKVPRAEYPRCGRGVDPGDDGEGLYEVNLHAGGMVAGEVFQYFTPKPDSSLFAHYGKTLKFVPEHIVTGGKFSYRNGDIPLALFQHYLRTGDPAIGAFAREHALLYADYAVGHSWGASAGLGHYYCDWFCNPYVYQRFAGLLLGWLTTGDPWLYENAKAMADWSLTAWKEGAPRDGRMSGGLDMIQSRASYVARMHLTLFDLTGDRVYLENAERLADWSARTQEPEGWWVMDPINPKSRSFRCTPIFTGYICQGLWPLMNRSGNPTLKSALLRAADWYLSMSEDARGSNPGTFPNSYWYGEKGSESRPSPISGNYATTQHAASALLEAYRATGDRACFYAANAAWVGVLNHQTPEGGIPLENDAVNSVWSHVLIESLPRFAATAEHDRLPIVLSSKTGIPGTSFMGKGASWDGETFVFELKYKADTFVKVRVYFPAGKPKRVVVNGKAVAGVRYDKKTKVAEFWVGKEGEMMVCGVRVER